MATDKKKTDTAQGPADEAAAQNLSGVQDKAGAEAALQGSEYQKSQAVLDAEQQLADFEATKPGEYVSGYQSRIDAMLDKIQNRGGFSYDFNADPLYQAYKDQYTHNGRVAMLDETAAAAAASGGYGSSYAASAGSQAYQGYLNDLNGKLPALYEAALDRYKAEGSAMQDTLSGLTAQEKAAHAGYEDTVADYYKGLAQYSSLTDSAYKKDYGEYQDWVDSITDMRDYYAGQEQQQFKNDLSRKDYELAVQKYQESIREWEAEQAAAREKWQTQLAEEQNQFAQQMAYKAATAKSTSGSTSTHSNTSRAGTASSHSSTTASQRRHTSSSSSTAKTETREKANYSTAALNSAHARWKK
ncbi:MAG: hypothetical protein LKJ90_10055 [Faecalibacterium sp.]|jgi:hypothetical protein|nr:hypothetical protein [Faecalibacterium sp.]